MNPTPRLLLVVPILLSGCRARGGGDAEPTIEPLSPEVGVFNVDSVLVELSDPPSRDDSPRFLRADGDLRPPGKRPIRIVCHRRGRGRLCGPVWCAGLSRTPDAGWSPLPAGPPWLVRGGRPRLLAHRRHRRRPLRHRTPTRSPPDILC